MTSESTEEREIEHKLRYLHGSPEERARALQGLTAAPLPDRRLLARCEALLDDRTITVLGIPYSFGEIRWCAADAVAALRGLFNIADPVVIADVFAPVSGAKAMGLLKEAGVEPKAGVEGTIEGLEALARMDRLPRRRIIRAPE